MFSGDYGFFDYKYNIAGYSGQDFGGPAQTLYLGISAALLVLLLARLRRSSREQALRLTGWVGLFLTLLYLGKTAWETVYDLRLEGSFNTGLLPLDTCSIVMPAALLAGFGRGKARRLAAAWLQTGGIVGGLGAMVSLNAFKYYPFFSFGAFYSMLWHFVMVLLGLLLAVTEPRLRLREAVCRGFALHLLFSLPVIAVDYLFDFDFMLYRQLGGVPIFEGVAASLTGAGLGFLNPLLMLLLYFLAFLLAFGIGQAAHLALHPVRRTRRRSLHS